MFGEGDWEGLTAKHPGFAVFWSFPMLVAAVDPAAEAKLDGLNEALTSGHYLTEREGLEFEGAAGGESTFPVLAADTSGLGEYASIQVQRLPSPGSPPILDPAAMGKDATAPGQTVERLTITAGQAYAQMLSLLTGAAYQDFDDYPTGYWNVGPTSYLRGRNGSLVASSVRNPESIWSAAVPGLAGPPMDESATAYRAIREHENKNTSAVQAIPEPRAVGEFDPGWVRAFDPLSEVPLGPYQPTAAAPANAASRKALVGHDLLPSLNLGGYVSQPVQLITTLSALPALENSAVFKGDLHASDPISVIRVRVAGVTGPSPVSLERIKEVAQLIAVRTHLTVDIVSGSSPAPTAVSLPAGAFRQPQLLLTEDWVKKGVAVAILAAVDKESVLLFTLILVVCALFVANSATAAVRSRRRELGVLACLGWTRPRIYAAVLGELALLGLGAGVAGGALSLPLAAALHLHVSLGRAILAVPAAVALAVAAGGVPAWLASRAEPIAAIRPPVLPARRARHLSGVIGLAVVNVLRTPGRSLVGAFSLAVGVAALTMLTAVTLAFRGTIVGSLLGNAVAVQVRGVDYVAVAATIALGVMAVADVLFLNIRERAAELATIRALGWPESAGRPPGGHRGRGNRALRLAGRRRGRAGGGGRVRRAVLGPAAAGCDRGRPGRRAGDRRRRAGTRSAAPAPADRAAARRGVTSRVYLRQRGRTVVP
jgi:putative ABC transport system permease protein